MQTPRKGFTLVELLVVIGIIALLISMLLPALNRARDSAQTVQCMSNLRQVHTALELYAQMNNGWQLPARGNAASGSNARETHWWGLQMLGAVWASQNTVATNDAQREELLKGQHKYLNCPANDLMKVNHSGSSAAWQTEYTYNGNLGDHRAHIPLDQGGRGDHPGEKIKKRVTIPRNVLVMIDMTTTPDEDADRFLTRDDLVTKVFPNGVIGRVGKQHRNFTHANALFHGGYVVSIQPLDLENWMIRVDNSRVEPGRWDKARESELPF